MPHSPKLRWTPGRRVHAMPAVLAWLMSVFALPVALTGAGVGHGGVNKDRGVVEHKVGGAFRCVATDHDGIYSLWPRRNGSERFFARPFWIPADAPWTAQRIYAVELRKGEAIGFRAGPDGRTVLAVSGDTEWPLPDDHYGWFRPNGTADTVIETCVYGPPRFVGGALVAVPVVVVVLLVAGAR